MRTIMSTTTTFDLHDSAPATVSHGRSKSGFWARLIAARTRQGQARVANILASKSDLALADLGFNAEQIAAIRATGAIPTTFWR